MREPGLERPARLRYFVVLPPAMAIALADR
jgi:hypothetical protein